MHSLCDILFYSELRDELGFSTSFVSHLVRSSIIASESPNDLKAWMKPLAAKGFPLPIGRLGEARFWSRQEVIDWLLIHNSQK